MHAFAPFAPLAPAPEARNAPAPRPAAGGPAVLLRLEGLAVFAAALATYGHLGQSPTAFAALFLAPDLAIAAYLFGPRLGAFLYNVAHAYLAPLALGSGGAQALALVWIAHIGLDRALGFGLKYPTGFADSHLGPVGRSAA
jgi:hypothetical protein